MPTKVVESLACGKIVISTDTGARSVPRTYSRLRVCSISAFPDAICQALEKEKSVDSADFESLKNDFLWENQLKKLKDRIEEI